MNKNFEQKSDQTSESKDYLQNQGKAYEEAVEDVLLQEHSPEQDYNIDKTAITETPSLTDHEIDKVLADGFQEKDLDVIFPSPDMPVSKRYQTKIDTLKNILTKSIKNCPDLAKARELVKKSLEEKSVEWLREQNREIDKKYRESKEKSDSIGKSVFITGLKLVPFAGPISDISEGVVGKDMYGNPLTKQQKVYKVIEGSIFLALDATGYGLIASKGVKACKLMTRSAALLRKLKVSPRIYKTVYKTGVFVKKNKNLARVADLMLDTVITNREERTSKDLEELKPLLGVTASDHEAIEIAREIPEFKSHIDQFQDKHGIKEHELTTKEHKDKAKKLLKSIESGDVGQ